MLLENFLNTVIVKLINLDARAFCHFEIQRQPAWLPPLTQKQIALTRGCFLIPFIANATFLAKKIIYSEILILFSKIQSIPNYPQLGIY